MGGVFGVRGPGSRGERSSFSALPSLPSPCTHLGQFSGTLKMLSVLQVSCPGLDHLGAEDHALQPRSLQGRKPKSSLCPAVEFGFLSYLTNSYAIASTVHPYFNNEKRVLFVL